MAHLCHSVVPAVEDSKKQVLFFTTSCQSPTPHPTPSLLPIKHPRRLVHEFYLPVRPEYSDATMLTLIQLIFSLFWTSVGFAGAEKLYHHRDHSDMQHFDSHQARLITNERAAKVRTDFPSQQRG